MKTYEETAQSVLEKIEELNKKKQKHRKIALRAMLSTGLVCIAVFSEVLIKRLPEPSAELPATATKTDAATQEKATTESMENDIIPTKNTPENAVVNGDINNTQTRHSTLVRGFDAPSACYATPSPGDIFISSPLKAALAHFGECDENGEIAYYVVIEVFEKTENSIIRNPWYGQTEVFEALQSTGLKVGLEVFDNGEAQTQTLTLLASKTEIERLAPNVKHGMFLRLCDE